MRKSTLLAKMFLCLSVMAISVIQLSAQKDTLKLGPTDDMYAVITADTVAGGAFAHDVYLLPRGAVYMQMLTFEIFHSVEIVGESGPEDIRPAIIIPKANATGDYSYGYIDVRGDGIEFTMKNIILQGRTAESDLTAIHKGGAIQVSGTNVRLILDHIIINGIKNNAVYVGRDGCYARITNSLFRNIVDMGNDYTGNVVTDWSAVGWRDSLIIRNNTFLNIGASSVYMGESAYKALIIDHNTIVGTSRTPIGLRNHHIIMTNNVLVGGRAYGNPLNSESLDPLSDSTSLVYSDTITNADQLAMMQEHFGVTDADRVFQLHNNMQYFPRFLVEDWQTLGPEGEPCMHQIFMSGYVDTVFMNYPNMDHSNNFGTMRSPSALLENAFDPQFVNDEAAVKQVLLPILEWQREYRANGEFAYFKNIDEEGKRFNLAWPIVEDFSYSNPEMLTGSTTGGPVGDLNWFPDYDPSTGIKVSKAHYSGINLSNYPNPFSGTTTIQYSLDRSSSVKLSVYDLTGKEVAVLVNEFQQAGDYKLDWSGASLSGGIYLFKIQTDSQSGIQRMIKL